MLRDRRRVGSPVVRDGDASAREACQVQPLVARAQNLKQLEPLGGGKLPLGRVAGIAEPEVGAGQLLEAFVGRRPLLQQLEREARRQLPLRQFDDFLGDEPLRVEKYDLLVSHGG